MEEVARYSETPIEMAASAVLPVLATCLQGKFDVVDQNGHSQPLCLYMYVIAKPGERKSGACDLTALPVKEYEEAYKKTHIGEILKQKKAYNDLVEDLEPTKITFLQEQTPETLERLIEIQTGLEEFQQFSGTFLFEDATIESLVELLAANCNRMAALSSEGGILSDLVRGRYGKPNTGLYLKGYDGDSYTVNRKGKRPIKLPGVYLTLLLFGQPSVIKEAIKSKVLVERSFMDRFICVPVRPMKGRHKFETGPFSKKIKESYFKLITKLMDIPVPKKPTQVRLSKEAHALLTKCRIDYDNRSAYAEEPFSGWIAKHASRVMRICALLHFAETEGAEGEISAEQMGKAIRIGEFFFQAAEYVYAQSFVPPAERDALEVWQMLIDSGAAEISCFDLYNKMRGRTRFGKPEKLKSALKLLEQHGYIKLVDATYSGKGRKPGKLIIMNPEALRAEG